MKSRFHFEPYLNLELYNEQRENDKRGFEQSYFNQAVKNTELAALSAYTLLYSKIVKKDTEKILTC